jgi:nucleoside-diphosphate kinase
MYEANITVQAIISYKWLADQNFMVHPRRHGLFFHDENIQVFIPGIEKEEKEFTTRLDKVVAMKLEAPGKEKFEQHYADLSSKGFFAGLVQYAASGPVVAMVWEGHNVVLTGRKMLGATRPDDSAPGTIRGDFAIDVGRNVIHGSDSVDSANKEIALWFGEQLTNWTSHSNSWVYEV